MRGVALLLVACLMSCSPGPDAELRLVTIHNSETGFSLRELPRETLRSLGLPTGLRWCEPAALRRARGYKSGTWSTG